MSSDTNALLVKLASIQDAGGDAYGRCRDLVPADVPVFVVGNGRSRLGATQSDFAEMDAAGLLIVCNSAGIDPVFAYTRRIHLWDDGSFNARMLARNPSLLHAHACFTNLSNRSEWPESRAPIFYNFTNGDDASILGSRIVPSCSGNSAIQVAYHLGSRDIRLVGFDYEYSDGSSNVYDDLLSSTRRCSSDSGVASNTRLMDWMQETYRLSHVVGRGGGRLRRTKWCGVMMCNLERDYEAEDV